MDEDEGVTRMRRCKGTPLAVTAVVSSALALLLAVVLLLTLATERRRDELCLTPTCIQAAYTVLNNMNTSMDPCDDFYEFACGNFLHTTSIPNDKSSVSTLSVTNDKLLQQIKSLFDGEPSPDEPRPFRLARTLFNICHNTARIEEQGNRPLNELLGKLGHWPVLRGNQWRESDFNWTDNSLNLRKVGFYVGLFVRVRMSPDAKNSTLKVFTIESPSFGISSKFLTKGMGNELVKAYYSYMVDVAVMLGANKQKAEMELEQSLKFEMSLAKISMTAESRRNSSVLYNPMKVREATIKYGIPFKKLVDNLLWPHDQIREEEVIILADVEYVAEFKKVIDKTPRRVQANYAMWRIVMSSIMHLTSALRQRELEFYSVTTGQTQIQNRMDECTGETTGVLGLAVGALYVAKYVSEHTKANAMDLVTDIRAVFDEILRDVDWMDDETKAAALDKAASMTAYVAYPDEVLDRRKLEDYYAMLHIDPEASYLAATLNVTMFITELAVKEYRKPLNKTYWVNHANPTVLNAFYSTIENSIELPSGILQDSFFSWRRPKYLNYGAIGFVIGHEITHGFDDQGRQMDKNGNLVNWWEANTQDKFLKKAKCIIDQYSNYSEVGVNLNGINTQGENIADNGGIKIAYLAYRKWASRFGDEPKLPGLEFSPRQMFWISAASIWCSVDRPEALKSSIIVNNHSPGRFRVIGPMSNMDEFAADFSCPLGSRMNPVHKCRVW